MEVLPYRIYSNASWEKSQPQASLFIAFYNNWKFLETVLASVEMQTHSNFELVICDDGSKPENVSHIHQFMKKTKIPTQHLWHEDKGFRKNEMLNKGIKNAKSSLIIFIDQDCVLHPEFVKEHIQNQKNGLILAGRRLEFSPQISQLISPERVGSGFIQKNLWWILPAICYRKDNQGLKGLFVKSPFLRKFLNRKKRGVVGCNFSVHKEDLLKVNAFDIRYQGAGTGEDSDIEWRLNQIGVVTKPFLYIGVQYHLFHKLQTRKNENESLFEQIKKNNEIVTSYGINLIPNGERILLD